MPKTIWIMAGESSGDDYGAHLAEALRAAEPDIILRGMGGEKMACAGVDRLIDSTELGVVGFFEVIRHLPLFIRLFRHAVRTAAKERPDAVVMIDYPGFNLRFAKCLKRLGIRVIWYVSPQVWAWKKKRIFTLEKCVDLMLCIFPFEPACYSPTRLPAEFIGHPLLQTLAPYSEPCRARDASSILVLPGSRTGELQRLLPDFLRACVLVHRANPTLRFEISLPRKRTLDFARQIIAETHLPDDAPDFILSYGNTREKMTTAVAGIAACGTVTVEAAILDLPLVVAYRVNRLTWWLAKRIVKLPFITIANLICNRCIYEERLQDDATPENLAASLEAILPGGTRRQFVLDGLNETRRRLGGKTDVAEKVACKVLDIAAHQSTSPHCTQPCH